MKLSVQQLNNLRQSILSLYLFIAPSKSSSKRDTTHMNRKVLQLSQSFTKIKDVNLQLYVITSRELIEDPPKSVTTHSGKWKIQSEYGDIGLTYQEDQTTAYVASRMPDVYSTCFSVLKRFIFIDLSIFGIFLVYFNYKYNLFDYVDTPKTYSHVVLISMVLFK